MPTPHRIGVAFGVTEVDHSISLCTQSVRVHDDQNQKDVVVRPGRLVRSRASLRLTTTGQDIPSALSAMCRSAAGRRWQIVQVSACWSQTPRGAVRLDAMELVAGRCWGHGSPNRCA